LSNVLFLDRKLASETPHIKQLWSYDLRTNMDFTLKTNPLARADLDEFVECFHADNRFERTPTWSPSNDVYAGRWRSFTYEELIAGDKANLDIFWLRDESLEDSANLPNPDVLAAEIVEDLRSALAQFEGIAEELDPEESDV
jgi:type I restriction enzyme M protein